MFEIDHHMPLSMNELVSDDAELDPGPLTDAILGNFGLSKFSLSDIDLLEIDDSEPVFTPNCCYYSESSLQQSLRSFTTPFLVLSLNVQSLYAKIDELRTLVYRYSVKNINFSVICLQETWLSSNQDISLLGLPGYSLTCHGKHASGHGGLAVYVLDSLKFSLLKSSTNNDNWEGMFLKISSPTHNRDFLVGNVYRPPRTTSDDYSAFLGSFIPVLNSFNNSRCACIVAGDFNIDLLKHNERSHVLDYLVAISAEGYCPVLSCPSRFTDNTATLIDHILFNSSFSIDQQTLLSGVLTNHISDHQPCFMSLHFRDQDGDDSRPCNGKYFTIHYRPDNFVQNVINDLERADIMGSLNRRIGIEAKYEIFIDIVSSTLNKHTIKKTIKANKYTVKKSPWITTGILKSIQYRDKLYTRIKRTIKNTTRYANLKINLNTYNRILRKTIKIAKESYFTDIFENCKNDSQKTWNNINSILNRKSKDDSFPDKVMHNNQFITDPQGILEALNEHFATVGKNVAEQVGTPPHSFKRYLNTPPNSTFTFHLVDKECVEKIIDHELKNKPSTGPDHISTKLIKQLKNVLSEPLTHLINQSFVSGVFPRALKIAKVKCLFKKGDPENPSNYRPISFLQAFSKIFEKVILKQLMHYFQSHDLLFKSQYGFRAQHSTEHAVLELVDRVSSLMDTGKTPFTLFLDLSKAFDCLNHQILLDKLHHYGVSGMALVLLRDYLTDRHQYIQHGDRNSASLQLDTGVPQGSILGPFLFLVFMNDFSSSSHEFSTINYADDTALTSTICSFSTNPIEHDINAELHKVTDWLRANQLCLNTNKSKLMFFYGKNRQVELPNIQLNSSTVEVVDHFNYLGIIISKDLSWKRHITSVSGRVCKTIGILCKLKHFLPTRVLRLIYESLIACRFNYGLSIWGNKPGITLKLQRKALRVIANAKYNAHCDPLFIKFSILKIEDQYRLRLLKFFYYMQNDRLPSYFRANFLQQNNTFHEYPTRHGDQYAVPRFHHEYVRSTLRYALVPLVNNTPENIISKVYTHSLKGFTAYVKNKFISSYEPNCTILNCYICSRR